MAIAITAPQLDAPLKVVQTRMQRHSRRNKGCFISKAVRERNNRVDNSRWQPKRAIKKSSPSRHAVREATIEEELNPPWAYDAAEWFRARLEDFDFDLEAWQASEQRKELFEAICAVRRELREQDSAVVHELQEVLEELRRQLTEQKKTLSY